MSKEFFTNSGIESESIAPMEAAPDFRVLREHALALSKFVPDRIPSDIDELVEAIRKKCPEANAWPYRDQETLRDYIVIDLSMDSPVSYQAQVDAKYDENGILQAIFPDTLAFISQEESTESGNGTIWEILTSRNFSPDKNGELKFLWSSENRAEDYLDGTSSEIPLKETHIERDSRGRLLAAGFYKRDNNSEYGCETNITRDKQLLSIRIEKSATVKIADSFYLNGNLIPFEVYDKELHDAEKYAEQAKREGIDL